MDSPDGLGTCQLNFPVTAAAGAIPELPENGGEDGQG